MDNGASRKKFLYLVVRAEAYCYHYDVLQLLHHLEHCKCTKDRLKLLFDFNLNSVCAVQSDLFIIDLKTLLRNDMDLLTGFFSLLLEEINGGQREKSRILIYKVLGVGKEPDDFADSQHLARMRNTLDPASFTTHRTIINLLKTTSFKTTALCDAALAYFSQSLFANPSLLATFKELWFGAAGGMATVFRVGVVVPVVIDLLHCGLEPNLHSRRSLLSSYRPHRTTVRGESLLLTLQCLSSWHEILGIELSHIEELFSKFKLILESDIYQSMLVLRSTTDFFSFDPYEKLACWVHKESNKQLNGQLASELKTLLKGNKTEPSSLENVSLGVFVKALSLRIMKIRSTYFGEYFKEYFLAQNSFEGNLKNVRIFVMSILSLKHLAKRLAEISDEQEKAQELLSSLTTNLNSRAIEGLNYVRAQSHSGTDEEEIAKLKLKFLNSF